MQNINYTEELKKSIELLEVEQDLSRLLLKEQFNTIYESLKPVNLLKNTLNEVISSPNLIDNIISTLVGLSTGYLSRKIVVGASGNVFRKLMGSVLQFGVTNIIAQHPDTIKSVGQFVVDRVFRKKEMKSNKSND